MRFELPPDKHALTNEQLLNDLRKVAEGFAPIPLSKERYEERGIFSSAGIRKRFGSWNRAIRLAGVQTKRMNIPVTELLQDLRLVAEKNRGATVTREEYDRHGTFSSAPLCRRFGGSWEEALRAANLGISSNSKFNGTDEGYFGVIEDVWQKLGRPPKRDEVRRPEYSVGGTTISRHFGSWRRALERFVEQAESTIATDELVSEPIIIASDADQVATPNNGVRRTRLCLKTL